MQAGKDFTFNPDYSLSFREGILFPVPKVRTLEDALPYLCAESSSLPVTTPLYYMYRGVYFSGDEEIFARHQIRHDLTVLAPGKIEGEYIKTIGHFHPLKPGKNETYPEYYEVLHGRATYLLQLNTQDGEVESIIAVEAEKGDKVYIPPSYGHVTINPGKEPLVMANLIEANFSSLYEPFRKKRGAAYYLMADGGGKEKFFFNPRYRNKVPLDVKKAGELSHPHPLIPTFGLYEAFLKAPASFAFLKG